MNPGDATALKEPRANGAGRASSPAPAERSLSGEKAQRIVDAMRRSVARRGTAGSTFDHVSREAGVSRGLLHYYFGTKEDLLTEVVRLQHDELIQEWRRAMAEEGAPLERVAAGMRRASDKFRSDPQFWHLQFDMYAIGLRTPRLRKRLRAMVRDLVQQIAEEVRRVTEEVPMPMPVPPEDIALAIAGAVDGIALLATVTDDDGQGAYRALLALVLSFTALGMMSDLA